MVFVRDMPVTMKVPLSQVMTVNASYRCRTDSDSGFDSCLKAMCGPGNLQGQFQGNLQLQMQMHQQMAEVQLQLQNCLLALEDAKTGANGGGHQLRPKANLRDSNRLPLWARKPLELLGGASTRRSADAQAVEDAPIVTPAAAAVGPPTAGLHDVGASARRRPKSRHIRSPRKRRLSMRSPRARRWAMRNPRTRG